MGWLGKLLKTDRNKVPLPQYFNPESDDYEAVQGKAGAINVNVVSGGGGAGSTVTVGAPLPAGTNKIGAVDAQLSGALPAGANKIGAVDAVLTGSNVTDVPPLQNAASAVSNGTPYAPITNVELAFEISGTSTTRAIVFEIAGPSGVYVPITAVSITDFSAMANQTTGGNDTTPESWLVAIPKGWTFRARISAISGGNVTVRGKAVAS